MAASDLRARAMQRLQQLMISGPTPGNILAPFGSMGIPTINGPRVVSGEPLTGDLVSRVRENTNTKQNQLNLSFSELMSPLPPEAPLVPPKAVEKRSTALTFAPATTTSQARRSAEEAMGITRPMYDNADRSKKSRNQE